MQSISTSTRNLMIIFLLSIFGLWQAPAWAQAEKFTIAGGGGAKNGSTYSAMLGDLASVCGTEDMVIEERVSSGGPENLQMLKANKVKAAIIPTDVLLAAKMDNATSVANIQTIVALHPEQVHLIARSDVKVEGGLSIGSFNVGGKDIVYNNPEDLKGRPIGAVGGSVVSARIISELLKLGWTVKEYPATVNLLQALTTKEIDAAVISAGAPSAAVGAIKGNFKLLPIRGNADTANVYGPAKIQYPNLNANKAVDTISAPALLVTRKWNSTEMLQTLSRFRQCILSNLGKIKDKEGTHAAWQDVNGDDRGKWSYYDLPAVSVVPVGGKK